MSENHQDNIQKMSFEQAYIQLQETVQQLEAGNLSLEEALNLYQKGMTLAKQCNFQLDNAELSIKKLAPSGEPVDFDEI